jgi:L-seryl-tRNA(Ser) seleniumtransferase
MGRYEQLGVTPVINASATLTRLGGSRMPPPVLAAMQEAAHAFVDLDLLQQRVGQRIAELTGNEACYVSCGAAAGIALATAACMVGTDPAGIANLPHLTGSRDSVVIHRSHRNGYDHAVRQVGARLREIGMAHTTQAWELEHALDERVACVVYFAGEHYASASLPLEDVIAAAHAKNVPVVVDAAAQIPPVASLWHFTKELGADVAVFSGGKGLRGPQPSGLVLGRADIVAGCRANGSPNHSIGRPMKVGKEEMLGLLAAVEWSLAQDEAAVLAEYESIVRGWVDGLSGIPNVRVERGYPSEAGQPHSRCVIRLEAGNAWTRDGLVRALMDGSPAIAVGGIGRDAIALNPQTLEPGEPEIVAERVRALLCAPAS